MRSLTSGLTIVALLATLVPSIAEEAPLTLTEPFAIRYLTGPNILNRMEPGETMRLGVFANRSDRPTTIVAVQGQRQVDLPLYRGPILDDLYDAAIPFDPTMIGPWTIVGARGTDTATINVPGVPVLFDLPLLIDLVAENIDGRGILSWTWPDVSGARIAGLTVGVSIMVTQEDNYDEYVLNFGLRENPIVVGNAGERFAIAVPEGELEGGRLFLFRVLLEFRDGTGALVAESLTFAKTLFSPIG